MDPPVAKINLMVQVRSLDVRILHTIMEVTLWPLAGTSEVGDERPTWVKRSWSPTRWREVGGSRLTRRELRGFIFLSLTL